MVQNILDIIQMKIDAITENLNVLDHYIIMKKDSMDYHAVADAAMDIRELEAKKHILEIMVDEIADLKKKEKEGSDEKGNSGCDKCRDVINVSCQCHKLRVGDRSEED
jgi:hypothetical protein